MRKAERKRQDDGKRRERGGGKEGKEGGKRLAG